MLSLPPMTLRFVADRHFQDNRGVQWGALVLFSVQFAALYFALASIEPLWQRLLYVLSSAAFCSAVARLGSSNRFARMALAAAASAALVTQASAARFYHAPLDHQLLASALFAFKDVKPVFMGLLPKMLSAFALVFALELGILFLVSKLPAKRPVHWMLLPPAIGAASWLGLARATPELRLVDASRALFVRTAAPHAGDLDVLPLLPSAKNTVPSVLFLFGESTRASDYCSSPVATCEIAPRVNALLPNRVAFNKMRSIASYTAISVGGVFTGTTQLGSQPELARAPTLFDYVNAVRVSGSKPASVYYTGQWPTIFERPKAVEAADRHIDVEGLFGRQIEDNLAIYREGVDRKLADRFVQDLPSFAQPQFITLHWAGTHAPYYMDPSDAPFAPYGDAVTWEAMPELHRTYQNAIRTQDVQIARTIEAFIAAQGKGPWLIVFTSDHGEAFGEHHAIFHGQNLYNEQTHVPAYIAWGNGALSEQQVANVRAQQNAPTVHLDLLPTFLDALGVWDSALLSPWRARMLGRSLLRPVDRAPRAIPISNCSAGFPCPMNTWGMLGDTHSYIAQAWDGWFLCADLDTPESAIVTHTECDRLHAASKTYFPLQPNGKPNQ
jgi:hypothetical protein